MKKFILIFCFFTVNLYAQIPATLSWTSDGKNTEKGWDAIHYIQTVLGADACEVPECFPDRKPDNASHLYDEMDPEAGPCFHFVLHPKDIDTGESFNPAKSRNEIQIKEAGPKKFMAYPGQMFTYKWKFKAAADMRISNRFTHFFQLKVWNSTNGNPLATLTAAKDSLQIRHDLYRGCLAGVRWSEIRGKWIDVTVRATFGEKGHYEVLLKELNGKVIINYSDDIKMWRDGDYVRPKWGIYRSDADSLNTANVLFADFTITNHAPVN